MRTRALPTSVQGLLALGAGGPTAGVEAYAEMGSIVLTDAQMRAWNTTPITIIAAPVDSLALLVPLWITSHTSIIAAAYTNNPSVSIRWIGGTANAMSSITPNIGNTDDHFTFALGGSGQVDLDPDIGQRPYGKALELIGSANATVVGDTTGNTCRITVAFLTIPSPV